MRGLNSACACPVGKNTGAPYLGGLRVTGGGGEGAANVKDVAGVLTNLYCAEEVFDDLEDRD